MKDLIQLTETRVYKENLERFQELSKDIFPGAMVEWLHDLGFFFQAAAKSHHGAYPGGLVQHSIAVAEKLQELTEHNDLEWERPESPIVIGLLHDICKAEDYLIIPKGGLGTDVEIKWNDNQLFPGHGEKSVYMILRYINDNSDFFLTFQEEQCIRFHMGAFTDKEQWKYYSAAVKQDENVMWTHHADMFVSQVLDK